MSLLDNIAPMTPRDPFASGALLPSVVETLSGSTYGILEHAHYVGQPTTVTVTCVEGAFAGKSWVVLRADVALTRRSLTVEGIGLETTPPVKVNGYPVSMWPEAMYGTCARCGATCSRVFLAQRDDEEGYCAKCVAAL